MTRSNCEQPQLLIYSYHLWTAWEVCGVIYCHKETKQSLRNDTEFTSLTRQERKKQALRKSHSSGVCDGRLQEIRLKVLSQLFAALDYL